MEIRENIREYCAGIIDLAYKKYVEEMKYHICLPIRTKQSFEQF